MLRQDDRNEGITGLPHVMAIAHLLPRCLGRTRDTRATAVVFYAGRRNAAIHPEAAVSVLTCPTRLILYVAAVTSILRRSRCNGGD